MASFPYEGVFIFSLSYHQVMMLEIVKYNLTPNPLSLASMCKRGHIAAESPGNGSKSFLGWREA